LRRTTSKLLTVLALVSGLLLSSVGAALALPDANRWPSSIEGYVRYEAPSRCLSTEQPGVREFRALLQRKFGANNAGISRACSGSATSDHNEGRAYDWMLNAFSSSDRAKANEVLNWLLATDEHGNKHAMARRLGISYIIWDRQVWRAYREPDRWHAYTGWSPHTDHIHFSFSWAGAQRSTSFWAALPEPEPAPLSFTGFKDVPVGAHFENAVGWMVEHNITKGRSEGIYDPSGTVNRGQMATFLWNLMDKPRNAPPSSFSDVADGVFYADAVAWLQEQGIATGRSDGTFAPGEQVTRGQMASFLWRLAGRPAATTPHTFPNVHADEHYDEAASWMAAHGIATGTNAGTFAGGDAITRAQMALFLHRLAQRPAAWASAPVVPSSVG
jgi:hypothetical protein